MVLHAFTRFLKSAVISGGAALLFVAAGCSDAPTTVTSATPAWGDTVGWTIGDAPSVIAGHIDADPGALQSASDAVRTSTGRIAVVVQGLEQLRLYDPAGLLVATAGGPSSSAFRGIGSIWIRPGDTIAVASNRTSRVEWFDINGTHTGGVAITDNANTLFVSPIGQLDDGDILSQSLVAGPPLPELGTHVVDTVALLLSRQRGNHSRVIARIPGPDQLVFDDGGGKRQVTIAFSLTASTAAAGNVVAAGNGHAPEVTLYDSTGALSRTIRFGAPVSPVTDDDRRMYREALLGPDPRPAVAEVFDRFAQQAGWPDSIPVWNRVLIDEDRCIWLRAYAAPWRLQDPESWFILSPEGAWLGSLVMPPGFSPTQIGRNFILGILDSPAGERQVVLYTLDRILRRRSG
jgi:hypothetical protein